MLSRRYFGLVLFVLVLWQKTSTADVGKQRKMNDSSEIYHTYHTAVQIFFGGYVDFEEFRLLGETNLFTHGKVFQRSENGKVLCVCPENPWRRNQRSDDERRFGEDEDCGWVIYQQVRKNGVKMENYEAGKKCFAPMQDLAIEIHYWKEKAVNCSTFMKMKVDEVDNCWRMADEMQNRKESDYKTYLTIVVAVIHLVFLAFVFHVLRENNDLRKSLEEATAERERLREELLSERERFHNIQETQ